MSTSNPDPTTVVFRKQNDGRILALFPYMEWAPGRCVYYEQEVDGIFDGSAHYKLCIARTTPATASESDALQKELENRGCKLNVVQSVSPHV